MWPSEVVTSRTYYVALALAKRGVGLTVVDEFTAREMTSDDLALFRFRKPIRIPVTAYMLHENSESAIFSRFLNSVEANLKDRHPFDL